MTNPSSSSSSTISTSSSSLISNIPTQVPSLTSTLNISHISSLVSIKLTDSNYLQWETQIKPFLVGQKYWCFIDGSYPCPPEYISSSPNPEYIQWFCTDKTLIGLINSTLSDPVLSLVVGLTTSKSVWDCLKQNFSQQSLANATHLRFQLLSINKGDKSIPEYLQHAKSLSDSLAAINQPVSSTDLVTSVLRGLGPDYSMLVTAIINFPPLPSFLDLRARISTFESMNVKSPTTDLNSANPTTAFMSSHNVHSSPNNRGNYILRGGRSVRGSRNYQYDYSSSNQNYNSAPRGGYTRGYRGRGRGRGRHQFHQGILGPSPFHTNGATQNGRQSNNTYQNSSNRHQNNNYEDEVSSTFAGLQIAPPTDPNWYLDSGATNHMSGDARSFTNRSEYSGNDQVQLGNGDFLPITHTGPM
ncbi:hypothetical protein ACHQM5_007105 [Ranunculus cassubicifolius]